MILQDKVISDRENAPSQISEYRDLSLIGQILAGKTRDDDNHNHKLHIVMFRKYLICVINLRSYNLRKYEGALNARKASLESVTKESNLADAFIKLYAHSRVYGMIQRN